jgi:chromosome partitioning protein
MATTKIAFANVKGGAGKTTLSISLAVRLHRMGRRVLVVDTDPEETALTWASKAGEADYEGPPVIRMDGRNLRRDLPNVARDFEFVVIDTPGNNGPAARAAMLVADLVILPVAPGGPDWWIFSEKTLSVLADARDLRSELAACVVFNRADATTLSKDTAEALKNAELRVLPSPIGRRVAIAEALVLGKGITDYQPTSEAAQEIDRFAKAVLRTLKEL